MTTKTLANLSNAIALAAKAHEGVFDKGGAPYIMHPITVMNRLLEKTTDEYTLMVAVLHDVIEDTFVTMDMLRESNYPEAVIYDLELMTKRKGETYDDYIRRIGTSYRATLVKLEDIGHNSDIRRLKGITEKDQERMAKYHRSYLYLIQRKKDMEEIFVRNTIRM